VVVDRERDLQAHHEVVDTQLECELKRVTSHEASLGSCETVLAEERKKLKEAWLIVSDVLATNISHARLDTREAELVDRERRLAKAQLQELVVAR
jgi:hypothetical protein